MRPQQMPFWPNEPERARYCVLHFRQTNPRTTHQFPLNNGLSPAPDLVLRSAHLILRRACPTWGARLEGWPQATEPAAILRDGAPQVGCSRLAYLMCRSRVNPRSVRLLKMRSVSLNSIRPIRWFHGIDLLSRLVRAYRNRHDADGGDL